jgi:hypothetical protein
LFIRENRRRTAGNLLGAETGQLGLHEWPAQRLMGTHCAYDAFLDERYVE